MGRRLPCKQDDQGSNPCNSTRVISSAGRASALHAEGRRFESCITYQPSFVDKRRFSTPGDTGSNPVEGTNGCGACSKRLGAESPRSRPALVAQWIRATVS